MKNRFQLAQWHVLLSDMHSLLNSDNAGKRNFTGKHLTQ